MNVGWTRCVSATASNSAATRLPAVNSPSRSSSGIALAISASLGASSCSTAMRPPLKCAIASFMLKRANGRLNEIVSPR